MKLEKLTQDESGILQRANGHILKLEDAVPKGKIRTLVVANPLTDISEVIDEMATGKSIFIPQGTNAFVASDFSDDTVHIKKRREGDETHFYPALVYAVQFYHVYYFLPYI